MLKNSSKVLPSVTMALYLLDLLQKEKRMKKLIILCITILLLQAQTLHVDHFTTDIFSSSSKGLKKIEMSLIIEGRYVEDENYKVIDALNVIIGSFYVENLATSQGKESLKKLLKEYSAKKHSVDIDDIYIINFETVDKPSANDIVQALKKEGCCNQHP
jgi:hypothetical protein